MIPLAHAGANPRAVMVHSLNAYSALVTVAGAVGTEYVAGGAEFETGCHLPACHDVGDHHIVADMLAFGDGHELLVDLISIFLLMTVCTIF